MDYLINAMTMTVSSLQNVQHASNVLVTVDTGVFYQQSYTVQQYSWIETDYIRWSGNVKKSL